MSTEPAVVLRAPQGSEVRVDHFPVVLGRSDPGSPIQPDCDLAAIDEDHLVGRQHAVLEWQEGRLLVTDLGSAGGTVLDGETLTAHRPTEVHDGATLTLGRVALGVRVAQDGAEAANGHAAHPEEQEDEEAIEAGASEGFGAAWDAEAEAGAPLPEAAPPPEPVAVASIEEAVTRLFTLFQEPAVSRMALSPGRRPQVCRDGAWSEAAEPALTAQVWRSFWTSFCRGAGIDPATPGYVPVMVGDAILAEGVLPPASIEPLFMAEKRGPRLSIEALVAAGTLEGEHATAIVEAVSAGMGILVAGPAQTGRTSLLEAIVDTLPLGARIALVERRPQVRFSAPRGMRLRAVEGQGAAAVATALSVSPDWVVVDDAEPTAAAALAWSTAGAGIPAVVAARTADVSAWRQRAVASLAERAGDAERARRELSATFPVTVRLVFGEDGPRVDSVDR